MGLQVVRPGIGNHRQEQVGVADRVELVTLLDGRRPKATLRWLAAAHAVLAEARVYNHLSTRSDPAADGDLLADLNPASEVVVTGALVEPSPARAAAGETAQFEHLGYFSADPESAPGAPVFNRTRTLKGTSAKLQTRG